MFKQAMMVAAVGAALAAPTAAHAVAAIKFNPAGTGAAGAVLITQLSWNAGNALFDNLFDVTSVAFRDGYIYGQTTLGSAALFGGGNIAPTARFTYQFGVPVRATASGPSSVSLEDRPGTSFFDIFVDTTPVPGELSVATGAGFGDNNAGVLTAGQTRIFHGSVTIEDLDNPGTKAFTLNDTEALNPPVTKLSPAAGGIGSTTATNNIGGSVSLHVNAISASAGYFPDAAIDFPAIIIDLTLSSAGFAAPFDAGVAASSKVVNVGGFFGAPQVTAVGTMPLNDFLCFKPGLGGNSSPCDVQTQISGNTFFRNEADVPEPHSLALLGLGIGLLGLLGRARRRRG